MVNSNPETVSTDFDISDRALLRAADPRGCARDRACREAARRGRAVGRPDAAQARPRAGGRRRPDSGHRRRTRSTSPRIGAGSRRSPASSAFASRPAARPNGGRGCWRSPSGSGIRCWCGRATCSAAGRCRSSTTPMHLRDFFDEAARVAPGHPVLIDSFLEDAFEADVDAICDGEPVHHRRRHAAHRGCRDSLRRLGLRPAAVS